MSQKRICTKKNCMETLTVHHIHQDRSWPVDTDGCARSGASNSIGIQHKKVCKKVAADVTAGFVWGEMEGWSTNVSSTEMSTISRHNVRLKSWRAFLRITAAVSASIPSFGMVRAASALSHVKGRAWRLDPEKVCRKQWNLHWHYPWRWGGKKNYNRCWKLKYASWFLSCLSMTNDPPSLSWVANVGSSQFGRKQIFCDIAPTTIMKPLKRQQYSVVGQTRFFYCGDKACLYNPSEHTEIRHSWRFGSLLLQVLSLAFCSIL